jgi:hypothetical protein
MVPADRKRLPGGPLGEDMADEERWKELYRYWLSRHVDGKPPSRGDIDPLPDIPRLVPNLMLLEIEGADYRYRVAGTEIEARADMYLTGRLIGLPETASEMVADWRRALDLTRDDQRPRLYFTRLPDNIIAKYVTLIVPLVDRQGRTEMILVGTFFDQYVTPGTRTLGMEPVEITL